MSDKSIVTAVVGTVLVLVVALAGLSVTGAFNSNVKTAAEAKPAPGFTLESVEGETVSLSDYEGDVVVIDLMTTTCLTCAEMTPTWKEMMERYPGDDVHFVAISPESKKTLRNWKQKHDIEMTYLSDTSSEVFLRKYQTHSPPGIVIVDGEGRIRYKKYGSFVSANEMSSQIDRILEEQDGQSGQ
ncbi:MAG: TlpA disulfide reductase family protein [Halobacteria archaeon]|nr:TlpA disulfide reductase family protein [Halobacteria archaeon]